MLPLMKKKKTLELFLAKTLELLSQTIFLNKNQSLLKKKIKVKIHYPSFQLLE